MQTAVEWLVKNYLDLSDEYNTMSLEEIVKQAKQKEKQQIKCAYLVGREDEQTLDYYPQKHSEDYYNETYGSKKSYTEAQKNEERINNTKIIRDVTSSQTEISDEEILKAAKECVYQDLDISVGSFELGAKWYREQLKSRQ